MRKLNIYKLNEKRFRDGANEKPTFDVKFG